MSQRTEWIDAQRTSVTFGEHEDDNNFEPQVLVLGANELIAIHGSRWEITKLVTMMAEAVGLPINSLDEEIREGLRDCYACEARSPSPCPICGREG